MQGSCRETPPIQGPEGRAGYISVPLMNFWYISSQTVEPAPHCPYINIKRGYIYDF